MVHDPSIPRPFAMQFYASTDTKPSRPSGSPHTRGAALVMALSFIVLATVLELGFSKMLSSEHSTARINSDIEAARQLSETSAQIVMSQGEKGNRSGRHHSPTAIAGSGWRPPYATIPVSGTKLAGSGAIDLIDASE